MSSSVAYSETRTLANDHNARALHDSYRLGRESLESKPSRPDEARKHEDIFLNIARTDSDRRNSLPRSDFRRVSLPFPSPYIRARVRDAGHNYEQNHLLSLPVTTKLIEANSLGWDIRVNLSGRRPRGSIPITSLPPTSA